MPPTVSLDPLMIEIIEDLRLDTKPRADITLAKDLAIAKIGRLGPELRTLKKFPEVKKKEIYDSLVASGEIVDTDPDSIPPAIQAILDAGYQSEYDGLDAKITRLKSLRDVADVEIAYRDEGLVVRRVA